MLVSTPARQETTALSSASTLEVQTAFCPHDSGYIHQIKGLLIASSNLEPPVMIVEPKDDVAMESYISEDIHLQCELSRSSGKVRWFKDGQVVEESHNLQLISEGPYRRLSILNSIEEDGGEYVCETDGDSVFFQLTVKSKVNI